MSFSKNLIVAALLAVAAAGQASANVYIFDTTYNGSTVTSVANAYGANFAVGDSLIETVRAVNGSWQAQGSIWPLIGMLESATRTGDAVYSFYRNSALVFSTSQLGATSAYAHVINSTNAPAGLSFDMLKVDYKLLSSSSQSNHFTNGFQSFASLAGNTFVAAKVPEPASFALLGLGFAGLAFARKHRATK